MKPLDFTISKNHYNGYKKVTVKDESGLITAMVKYCICPVTDFKDEDRMSKQGKPYVSESHRANRNIVTRGELGLIDFEGKAAAFEKLLKAMTRKNIWFIAVPSQSNLNDKRNTRMHIAYRLKKPYSINSEAFKTQAKGFFKHIGYKWDKSDSGIDTIATFNGSGYFSPTYQLPNDAKTKEIKHKYTDNDQINKDIERNIGKKAKPYKPTKPTSNEENKAGAAKEAKKNKKVKKTDFDTHVLQKSQAYFVKSDLPIPIATGGYKTIGELKAELSEMEEGGEGERPTISGLGCPECSSKHKSSDDPERERYAFASYDDAGEMFVFCGGSHNQMYKPSSNTVTVWRTLNTITGEAKYIILNDGEIHYTDTSVGTVIMSAPSCADELNSRYNMGKMDENGNYSRGLTVYSHVTAVPSLQLWRNPFLKAGLMPKESVYNLAAKPKFIPTPEEPNPLVKTALKGFDKDTKWKGTPIGIIYLSYYLFHSEQIMAMLFLVNPQRGVGKSTMVLDIPKWYLGLGWGMMDNSAIENSWDDAKVGVRGLCYEDIENLDKKTKKKFVADLKSDATAGGYKLLNPKGKGQIRSFGHNTLGTTNHRNQIPLDGNYDRRLHIVDFKPVNDPKLNGAFDEKRSTDVNLKNMVNYLYKVYTECEANMDDELFGYLNVHTPKTKVKEETARGNLKNGEQIGLALMSCSSKEELKEKLQELVVIEEMMNLDRWIDNLNVSPRGNLNISSMELQKLYNMSRNGEANSYTSKGILFILGLTDHFPDGDKPIKIDGNLTRGIQIKVIKKDTPSYEKKSESYKY